MGTVKFRKYILSPLLSLLISIIIAGIFIMILGKNPADIFNRFVTGAFGSSYGIGMILFQSTTLIFTGLSVAFAFKAGLFNIGAEGQMFAGSFLTAWAGYYFSSLPPLILLPLCVIAGFAGGAVWGGIAGYFKGRFGSHEVIMTIMLNFIAVALIGYIVNNVFNSGSSIHTPEISQNSVIPRLDSATGLFRGSPFNFSILLAIFCCVLMSYLFNRTPAGYEIKTLGFNLAAAKYARMNIKKLFLFTMMFSGGLAGLSGTNFVLGYKHYYEIGFSEGAGFLGIAIALISKNNPYAIIFVSIFFGMLEYGGLVINSEVPKELVTMLQASIIFLLIIFTSVFNKNETA